MAGPLIGGAVVESLALSLGSQVSAYSSMWLIMLVPAMGTLAIALFWCFRRAKG